MRSICTILAIFSFSFLFASEEIVVHLSSNENLASLYLDPFQDQQSGFEKEYLKSLEKILRFDLDHNGKTETVAATKDYLDQSKNEKDLRVFDSARWRNFGLDYVIKVSISNKQLSAAAFNVKTCAIKGLNGIALSGNFAKDRRAIHQVADAIHHALFKTLGIADTRILYTVRTRHSANSSDWVTEVWEADYDGANPRQLTHDGHLCVTPTYVPFQKEGHCHNFFYVSYKVGQPKIFAANVEGGIGKRMTFLRGNQLMPAFSPTKDKIAFISDITGNPDLFIQDFSADKGLLGKPSQIFSAPGGAQGSPTFSPDGNKIAFVSNKDGTARIYMITIPLLGASLKEIHPTLISRKNRDNTSPAWSPDGTKIAYSASTQGTRQIWIYDFKTGTEMQLTDGYGHKENPSWAPDSLHLVFNSSTTSKSELFLINLNQKKAVQVSSGPGEKRFPAWEPLNSF